MNMDTINVCKFYFIYSKDTKSVEFRFSNKKTTTHSIKNVFSGTYNECVSKCKELNIEYSDTKALESEKIFFTYIDKFAGWSHEFNYIVSACNSIQENESPFNFVWKTAITEGTPRISKYDLDGNPSTIESFWDIINEKFKDIIEQNPDFFTLYSKTIK